MIRYSIGFLVIVIIAALLAFSGLTVGAASIAKIVFYIFLPLFVVSALFVALIFKSKARFERKQMRYS